MVKTTNAHAEFLGPAERLGFPDERQRVALRCRSLVKSFGDQFTVDDVSFSVAAGDILVLLGPSGCGKTTTLRLIAGFEHLDGGSIEVAGTVVADSSTHMPPERRGVGMVFQDYAVFPHLSVGRNVGFALGKGEEARQRILELLSFVGLQGQENKMPHELSGGEQQRVALARALSLEPAILLLDEPFSNLDASLRADVRAEVRSLLKENGITAVFVTHDQEEALFLGDLIAVMHEGRFEQVDTPENIYHRPRTRFVAEFIGQTDIIEGMIVKGGVETPFGFLPRAVTLPEGTGVELALRPEHVSLMPAAQGAGRIVSRQFAGMSYLYQVALPDGHTLRSRLPFSMRYEIGDAVDIKPLFDDSLPCFHLGKAI